MVGKEALPTGGRALSQPLLYNYLSPNMITNEDRELHKAKPAEGKALTSKKTDALTRNDFPFSDRGSLLQFNAIKAAVPIASFRSEQPLNCLLNGGAEGAKSTTEARSKSVFSADVTAEWIDDSSTGTGQFKAA
ncbi:hypothetical protein L6452_18577 [Arctium lappa]|uniref:Uncharacterized protein n=1 Tax=Arctium lappa TaxID=4217 RepID=A0ACB9C6S1_ARCLA|nr:hypothetical protein L6452_18577 [Arctium lappa]